MTHLLAVCPHGFFIRRLQPFFLQHGIIVAGICKEPAKALDEFYHSRSDVILLDAHWWPRTISVDQLMEQWLSKDASLKVIVLYNFMEQYLLEKAQLAGAKGYICRLTSSRHSIVHCIKSVDLANYQFELAG